MVTYLTLTQKFKVQVLVRVPKYKENIMSRSFKKILKDIEMKEKAEKDKQPYAQPLRPRSAVFKSGKEYNRQKNKQETKQIADNW